MANPTSAQVFAQFRAGSTNMAVTSAGTIDRITNAFKLPQQLPAERAYFSGMDQLGHAPKTQVLQLWNKLQGIPEVVFHAPSWARRSA